MGYTPSELGLTPNRPPENGIGDLNKRDATTGRVVGDTWIQTDSATKTVLAVWVHDGTEWIEF